MIDEEGEGPKAVDLVDRLRPPVLVLDVQMPGENRLEITHRIAQRGQGPGGHGVHARR